MSEGENVKVAVRVRPFNSRERKRGAECIVEMKGAQTFLRDPENPDEEERSFTFDFSYWSHDGCKELDTGYFGKDASHPSGSKFCDQKTVYNDLGQGILKNAWEGYNSTLFAYGQTGSGKSWSMVGYGVNKGIVPQYCEDTFKKIDEAKSQGDADTVFEISFSMLEIYNENVHDLLNPQPNKKGGLRVRQHPKKGFYADGLTDCPVDSYVMIEDKMEEGTANRTVAATAMNATSSRAHTIVGIKLVQKKKNAAGEETAKSSIVNLVDLAGSERASNTGATGDRLKEGAAINQSLSSLGNVIAALADKASGKRVKVPYRDSVLTKLLKNALAGNSKTIMIAAISPADINYEETLSTLRYADRAKQIKTTATVNEDPTEKLIRELQEENERLKKMFESGTIDIDKDIDDDADDLTEEEKAALRKELEQDYKEQLENQDQEMAELKKAYEDKLKAAHENQGKSHAAENMKKRGTTPHILNLNMDPQLSGKIAHFIESDSVKVGKDDQCDLKLLGPSIMGQHAVFCKEGDALFLEKACNSARLLVNGEPCIEKTDIHHNDRVMFGTTQLYMFVNPKERDAKKDWPSITFEDAQEEIATNAGFDMKSEHKSKDQMILQENIMEMLPEINQANSISEDLDKKMRFEMVMVQPEARGDLKGRTEVYVKVTDMETDMSWYWKKDKFINRKSAMDDMFDKFKDGEEWQVATEMDPFTEDEKAEVPIGCCKVWLKSLAYGIAVKDEQDFEIEDYEGEDIGMLDVEVVPCDAKGKEKPQDDDDACVSEPNDLVGTDVHVLVKIKGAKGLPSKYTNVCAMYKFYGDEEFQKTNVVATSDPAWVHTKVFSFKPATKELVNFLQNSGIIVQVWGQQKPSSVRRKVNTRNAMEKRSLAKGGANAANKNTKMADPERQKFKMENMMLEKRVDKLERKMHHYKRFIEELDKKKRQAVATRIVRGVYNAKSDKAAENWYAKVGKMKFKMMKIPPEAEKQNASKKDNKDDDEPDEMDHFYDILDIVNEESKTCTIL